MQHLSKAVWPKRQWALCLFTAWLLLPTALPANPAAREELNKTLENIAEATARKNKLSKENAAVEKELSELQKESVDMAARLRADEQRLDELEEKQAILKAQSNEKQKNLDERRKELAAITQAMIRLGYTPEQAVIAMPGDYAETLQAAKTLGVAVSTIREEAEELKLQLKELDALHQNMEKNQKELQKEQQRLTNQQDEMKEKLDERRKLQKKLGSEQQAEAAKLAKLSKRSSNLQELIRSIETQEAKDAEPKPSRPGKAMEQSKRELRSFVNAKGRILKPVSGKLTGSFGQQKGKNDTYKGVMIETRDNAQVVSPYDGEVMYTGPFLTYGNLVIIRHSDQFYTLLAGFERIDCNPGQFLLEGEPIGAMGTTSNGGTDLYLELRERNRPIDPEPWIAGLEGRGRG